MEEKTTCNPDIERILVPMAIGSEGTLALKQALVFQKTYNCEIILLHVIKGKLNFFNRNNTSNQKTRLYKAENKIKKFAASFFGGKLPEFISIKVATGNLVPSIVEASNNLNPDLIVLKKRERKASRFSVLSREKADLIISSAKCPVITVNDFINPNAINNIVIPVDITKKIANKIEWGKYLALKFNAKVHVVSILDLNIAPISSLAFRKADEIRSSLISSGIDSEVVVLKSLKESMHKTLLKYIEKHSPDMVLTMTHQESILFDNYIGHFATEIIHGSKSPVFSLVPRKETILTNILDILKSNKHQAIY